MIQQFAAAAVAVSCDVCCMAVMSNIIIIKQIRATVIVTLTHSIEPKGCGPAGWSKCP